MEWLLGNALAASLAAVLVAVLTRFVRRPALCHFLWVLVLLRLFAPPGLSLGLLPAGWTSGSAASSRHESRTARELAPPPAELAPAEGTQPGASPSSTSLPALPMELVRRLPIDGSAADPEARAPRGGGRVAPPTSPADPAGSTASTLVVSLGLVWALGSAIALGVLLRRVLRFQDTLRSARRAGARTEQDLRRLADRLGIARPPRVELVDARVPPMVWGGLRRARILLPAGLVGEMPRPRIQTLLAHELAHVARRDPWVRWIEVAATVGFWWLPTVWWARARLRFAEEMACDAWVSWLLPGQGRAYADALVDTLDSLHETRGSAPPLASGVRPLESFRRRLTMILTTTPSRAPRLPGRAGLLALSTVILGTSLGTATARQDAAAGIVSDPTQETPPEPTTPILPSATQPDTNAVLKLLEGLLLEDVSITGLEEDLHVVAQVGDDFDIQEFARRMEQLSGYSPHQVRIDGGRLQLVARRAVAEVLEAGDQVILRCPSHPELSSTYRVRADGVITIPTVGRFVAAGHSLDALRAQLLHGFADLLVAPQLELQRVPAARPAKQEAFVIRLENADVRDVAPILEELLTRNPGATAAVRSDARTNSLLIRGSASLREELLRLVAQLDRRVEDPAARSSSLQVVPLRHAFAEELADVLLRLLVERRAQDPDSISCDVVPDARTNSLLVRGEDPARRQVLELIAGLDRPVAPTAEDPADSVRRRIDELSAERKLLSARLAAVELELKELQDRVPETGRR